MHWLSSPLHLVSVVVAVALVVGLLGVVHLRRRGAVGRDRVEAA